MALKLLRTDTIHYTLHYGHVRLKPSVGQTLANELLTLCKRKWIPRRKLNWLTPPIMAKSDWILCDYILGCKAKYNKGKIMSKYSNAIVVADGFKSYFKIWSIFSFYIISVIIDLTVSTICSQHCRKRVAKIHIPCTLNANIY